MLLSTILGAPDATAQSRPIVAAASDLKFALEEIASRFATDRGEHIELVFGSSGLLARQIRDGAPFEMFLSADESFVHLLADAGLTRDRGALYAVGRIVLFAPHGSPLALDPEFQGLHAVLARGGVMKFAVANPLHAPYGRAAEAALRKRDLWDPLQSSLVLGENVSQAAQFATSGNAVGGILAYSLVLAPPLRDQGSHVLIPESDHPRLRQRMVLLERAGTTTEHFYQYLQEPAAREILRRFGFSLPA